MTDYNLLRTPFFRFVAARFLSALGTQFILFATPLLVFKATGSIASAGLSFAIEWCIGIIALPFAGVLADRVGGTRLYAISDAVRFATCIVTFGLLLIYPDQVFLVVTLAAGVMSFCLNQAFVALESVVPKYIPREHIHKGQSVLQAVDQVSLLAGPVIAVALVTLVEKEALYLVASLAFLVSFLNLVLSRKINETSENARARSPFSDLLVGAQTLRRLPVLMLLCLYGVLVNLVFCTLLAVGAAVVTGTFGLPESYFGALMLCASLLTILTMFVVPRLVARFSINAMGIASFIGVSAGGLVVAFANEYWVFFLGFSMVMAADAVAGVYLRTERAKIIPREHLGKTLGLMVLIIVSSYPISGLIVNLASERIGIQSLMLNLSLVCLAGNFLILKFLRTGMARANQIQDVPAT